MKFQPHCVCKEQKDMCFPAKERERERGSLSSYQVETLRVSLQATQTGNCGLQRLTAQERRKRRTAGAAAYLTLQLQAWLEGARPCTTPNRKKRKESANHRKSLGIIMWVRYYSAFCVPIARKRRPGELAPSLAWDRPAQSLSSIKPATQPTNVGGCLPRLRSLSLLALIYLGDTRLIPVRYRYHTWAERQEFCAVDSCCIHMGNTTPESRIVPLGLTGSQVLQAGKPDKIGMLNSVPRPCQGRGVPIRVNNILLHNRRLIPEICTMRQ
jgi:hypothetical protein